MGVDFQSHSLAATQTVEKLLRTGIAYCSVDGNVPLKRQEEMEYLLLRSDGSSKKRAKIELTYLPSSFLLVLDELLVGPVRSIHTEFATSLISFFFCAEPPPVEFESCGAALLAGYFIAAMSDHGLCEECILQFTDERSLDPLMAMIRTLGKKS